MPSEQEQVTGRARVAAVLMGVGSRLCGLAFRLNPPPAICADCRSPLWHEDDECEACALNDERQVIAREAYDQGGMDAYREARYDFGGERV